MTVAELIEALKTMPQDAIVICDEREPPNLSMMPNPALSELFLRDCANPSGTPVRRRLVTL